MWYQYSLAISSPYGFTDGEQIDYYCSGFSSNDLCQIYDLNEPVTTKLLNTSMTMTTHKQIATITVQELNSLGTDNEIQGSARVSITAPYEILERTLIGSIIILIFEVSLYQIFEKKPKQENI